MNNFDYEIDTNTLRVRILYLVLVGFSRERSHDYLEAIHGNKNSDQYAR
jgi:hypothetical protein